MAYFGVQRRHEDGGHAKKAVVEGNLLGGKVSHGPQEEDIAVPTVREALRRGKREG